jgi:antitoxin component YwqK of YwqJK toxin-antitoxin module
LPATNHMRKPLPAIMKNILLIIFICFLNQLSAQEKVGMKDLYVENDLTYKIADDKLFSGQAQHVRKNGHLVYEEYFENGKLTKSITYYNGTEKPTPARETNFGLDKPTTEYKHFDKSGKKTLIEQYENDKLIYRCEYQKNKKHGIEYCLNEDGTELRTEYRNGKKIKKK